MVKNKIKKALRKLKSIKIQLSLRVKLKKYRQTEDDFKPYFTSETRGILSKVHIKKIISELNKEVASRLETFLHHGSNWNLVKIYSLELKIVKYAPILGGCKQGNLPNFLKNKHCLLDLSSPANQCFLYSVAAGILQPPAKNASRASQYKTLVEKFNTNGISLPMTLDSIQLFEAQNEVSINCYEINPVSHEPGVLHISSEENKKHHVNILLYKGHYYTIRSLSRFLCGFRCSNRKKGYYCKTCLTKKYSEQALKEHENFCRINGVKPKGKVPTLGSGEDLLQFRNYEKKFMAPFVIYMDFETYQSRVTNKRASGKKTKFNTQHKQLSIGMKRVCHVNDKFNGPVRCYTGENCAKKAIEMLMEEQSRINVILNECRYPMTNTAETWQMLKKATQCYICDSVFHGDKKCRDHNHLQSPKVTEEHPFGNVLGIACNRCNLKYSSISNEPKIPVFLHNGSKYDFKLLIRDLCQNSENQLKIIPRTS